MNPFKPLVVPFVFTSAMVAGSVAYGTGHGEGWASNTILAGLPVLIIWNAIQIYQAHGARDKASCGVFAVMNLTTYAAFGIYCTMWVTGDGP